VGRKIRKRFEVDDVKKKTMYRSFEGKVKSYNEKRQLFPVEGKAFMKQLGDEVLKFVERVEYKSPGGNGVHVQNAKFDFMTISACTGTETNLVGR
jgi:hypothetical protein